MLSKKQLLLGALALLSMTMLDCKKPGGSSILTQFPTEQEFIGNEREFEAYRSLFLKKEQFYASNEEYAQYLAMLRSPDFQREYLEEWELAERSRAGELTKNQPSTAARIGNYPRTKGHILVTDNPISSGINSGHAGIVYSDNETIEAMPNGGVQRLPNDWDWRYWSAKVYGLKATGVTDYQHENAAN